MVLPDAAVSGHTERTLAQNLKHVAETMIVQEELVDDVGKDVAAGARGPVEHLALGCHLRR